MLTTPRYRLTLRKENGEVMELLDRATGVRWSMGRTAAGGGRSRRPVRRRLGARSAARARTGSRSAGRALASTLTLVYDSARPGRASTPPSRSSRAPPRSTCGSSSSRASNIPLSATLFPADLSLPAADVRAAYMPTFLPGTRFLPGFFRGPHKNVETYPSRWAFADYLSADIGRSHIALYTVNPAPKPIAPVDLGFVRHAEPAPCSGPSFCATHAFQTWVERGQKWTSPTVRVRVGGAVEQSLSAYRDDNGIERLPSLADKVGGRLGALVRSPHQGGPLEGAAGVQPVGIAPGAAADARARPSGGVPVGRIRRGASGLPAARSTLGRQRRPQPDDGGGAVVRPARHAVPQRQLVGHDGAERAGPPLAARAEGHRRPEHRGTAVTEQFGPHDGYIVSPHAPAVRKRIDGVFEEWKSTSRLDCLFFDQIGARPWRRDFNPAAPSPLAYYDGWLSLFAPYADRCVMVEDGWDRLASMSSGFHGGVLQMSRQFEWPNSRWGEGNWEPYPIASRLFGDKVLMYQHDLYEPTMTTDPETLAFNVAFGFMLSYAWDESSRRTASWGEARRPGAADARAALRRPAAGGVPGRAAGRDRVGVRGRLQRPRQLEQASRWRSSGQLLAPPRVRRA